VEDYLPEVRTCSVNSEGAHIRLGPFEYLDIERYQCSLDRTVRVRAAWSFIDDDTKNLSYPAKKKLLKDASSIFMPTTQIETQALPLGGRVRWYLEFFSR
jgi:hypothetical protein